MASKFTDDVLIGRSNYFQWLGNASLYLEINGYMPYCDGLEMEPDRDLYFTKDDNKAKSSELGVKYSEKLSEYTRNTRKALGALKLTISPDNANWFKDKFSAIALWKAIQNTFGELGLDIIGRFYTTLSNANYDNCTLMDEYTSQIQSSAYYL